MIVTHDELDAFLTICRYKNLTSAANEMCITQAALSARLKRLEDAIGCTLFLRSKGKRKLSFTPKGQKAYALALQYQDILSQIKNLGATEDDETLRIVAHTSTANYLLAPAFDRFMESFPHIHLSIVNQNASDAIPDLIRGFTHMAFVTGKIENDQIVATPIVSDPMTLLCSMESTYPEMVTQSMLHTKDEVYSYWSAEVAYWHQTVFGKNILPYVKLELMGQIGKNIAKPGKWGFVPKSMANELCKTLPVRQCRTTFPLPDRTVYLLRSRETAEAPNIRLFLDTLREIFEEQQIEGFRN